MERVKKFFSHLLIPGETNNFRAKSLHTDFLGLYLVFALVLSFTFKQFGLSNVLGFATDISVDKLFQLTNQQREKNGLPDLTYNDKLSQAAYAKAQDMFAKNYWAHYSPTGSTPWDFILGSGYQYEYAGENLAKNFLFSQGVVDAWMNSPTHRDNILKRDYTEVGYAVVNGTLNGEQTTLVVQMFGKPLYNSIAAKQPETNTKPDVQAQQQNVPEAKPAVSQKPVIANQEGVVLSKETKPLFSLPTLSYNINLVFFSFLLLALGLDFYFASKFNIIRVGGKNLAHFVFIFFMFLGLLIISRGAII